MPRFTEVAVALAAFSGAADAFWRMPCRGRTALGRIDPIVDVGKAAGHSHTLQGSNAISLTSDSATLLGDSSCTSCQINQDRSAYWTPNVYFRHSNGQYEAVEQAGGMLAYYLLYGDDIQPFPAGFKMLSGDTNRRNFTCAVPEPPKSDWTGYEVTQPALAQKALGFNCLNYGRAAEASLGRHFLPDKDFLDANCADGVRFELMFPSCWNGKDLDAPDHKSHMAFPDQVMSGNCPPGFDTRVPSLFYETIWNTQKFIGQDGEFVISNGDVKGYGYHGDFMEGWQPGFLEQAIGTCTSLSGVVEDCNIFDIVSDADMASCTAPMPALLANEDAAGPMMALPGNNPITLGPEPANFGATSNSTGSFVPVASVISSILPKASSASTGAVSNNLKVAAAAVPASAASSEAATAVPASAVSSEAATPSPSCASRKTIIKGAEAWDICIEEEIVHVTADGEAVTDDAAKVKRHMHHHAHKHHA